MPIRALQVLRPTHLTLVIRSKDRRDVHADRAFRNMPKEALRADVPGCDDSVWGQRDECVLGEAFNAGAARLRVIDAPITRWSSLKTGPRAMLRRLTRLACALAATPSCQFAEVNSSGRSASSHERQRLTPLALRNTLALIGGRVDTSLRILLVEDHETVRQGLKLLIDREPDLKS